MLRTAEIFQSNMVIQMEKEVKIWGEADADTKIIVEIQDQTVQTVSDYEGKWIAVLSPLKASEQEELIIKTKDDILKYLNIAVGEVWIAGGQSNMEFWMRYEKHIEAEREGCKNSQIRFYDVPEVSYEGQRESFDYSKVGIWRMTDTENIDYFSAVGYYFEKKLAAELNVPVGIVGCNWGGTTASAWMKKESVEKVGKQWMDAYLEQTKGLDMHRFYEEQNECPLNDRGNAMTDPFSAFILPKTRTPEELQEFFSNVSSGGENFMQMILPHTFPGVLYENMVKTIGGFTARGILWYQGESDDVDGRQSLYEKMLKQLISDWRELWKEELPVLLVQLPGWESWLALENLDYNSIRECQRQVAEDVENVYLCSISDAGEQFDIHPKNKKVVGDRLYLLAMGHIYQKELLCDAPTVEQVERKEDQIIIRFANAGEGLFCKGEIINALHVESDGKRIDFSFSIEENRILIKLHEASVYNQELTVSFAQDKWYQVNLFNSAGIPAIPFITIIL